MNLHKHQLYLLEPDSESFKIWSAIIRINTEGKSLIMKLGPGLLPLAFEWDWTFVIPLIYSISPFFYSAYIIMHSATKYGSELKSCISLQI